MIGGAEAEARGVQRSFASEIFHNLSQPLTALQCVLELSLFRDQTTEELRASVETALRNCRVFAPAASVLLWELDEASDPGDPSANHRLGSLLRELQEELLPLCESAGQRFELQLQSGPIVVYGDKTKLMRGLFYFTRNMYFATLLRALRSAFRVRSTNQGQAEITIATSSCLPINPSAENETAATHPCEIEIARRSFRAVGGDFVLVSSEVCPSVWRATLPIA